MNHEETLALLHDYDIDELDAPRRADLEAHLSSCEECMELARVFRNLMEAARAAGVDHPGTADIVTYAMHRGDLDAADREAIEAHLGRCESCTAEVEHVRTVELEAREGRGRASLTPVETTPGRARGLPRGWMALAAAVVVAALVYPAYLGVIRLPAVEAQRDEAVGEVGRLSQEAAKAAGQVESLRGFEGAVDLHVLRPAARGAGESTRVGVGPGQPFVLLAIELLVPGDIPPGDPLRLRIVDEAGREAWASTVSAGEARAAVRGAGVLTIVLPVEELGMGRYILTAHAPEPSTAPLATLGFELIRTP